MNFAEWLDNNEKEDTMTTGEFVNSLIVENNSERLMTTDNACEVVMKFNCFLKGVCFHELTKESLIDLRNTIDTIFEDIYQDHRKNRISWCGRCKYELSRNCIIPNEDEVSEGKEYGVIKIHGCDEMNCKKFIDFSE